MSGYSYYANRRALRALGIVSVILLLIAVAKHTPPTWEDLLALYLSKRTIIVPGIGLAVLCIFLALRIERIVQQKRALTESSNHIRVYFPYDFGPIFKEPNPFHYHSRSEFVSALGEYAVRMGYKTGWVYYRSQELWPTL